MKTFLVVATFVVAVTGAVFVVGSLRSLLAIGPRNYLSGLVALIPLVLLIPATLLSLLFLKSKVRLALRLLPASVGAFTLLIGLGVLWFQVNNPYFGFYYHKNQLDQAVNLIMSGVISPDQDGYAKLPDQYKDLTLTHLVLVSDTLNGSTYFFIVGTDDFDPSTWGYLFRPDGSEPPEAGMCQKWGLLQPSTPNWYACFYGPYDGARLWGR